MTGCAWAGCSRPAVGVVAGYPMCRPCTRLHYELEGPPPTPEAEQIVRLVKAGHTDNQIAQKLDVTVGHVVGIRRKAGLRKDRTVECGTRYGYRKHKQRGETPCLLCKQVQSDYDRRRWLARTQQAS